ncbi:MarR family winged helix-turn-helix transcriptional regulator [Aeromicrobium duanguangcaii]|uniref:MarR family winged helix-turn-helix transcriptional regulator n=1 Tax=Aeromicrobium duanguangcaii TaxID=2968086 RepID=A0ABY5KI44_9ACTN|nr:MarR family winged helix-turn-helix transcriptional regulator [Aeromicrobium duanguangcaii]MCD9153489.1 MarR family winged helix-turn-helix transcriptional regulator [Aeromicrobium duanguangcaii]UUI69423.1 MarR family winged helix-turn-helix transcriptional regulator [Aeromicrobium duanguangcaii]
MTSITQAARANPAWGALAAIARIERGRRAADSLRFTHADQRLLWMFSDGKPRTLREIADELGLEQSTVNRQVNSALKAGRLRRSREPGQTAWQFLATDEALAEFVRDLQDHLALLEQGLQAVPEDERSRFLEHLGAFATAYNEAATQR